jgi:TIR domain-containing protein
MIKQRVFVSYSHDPPENSKFARQLAERLRSVGFEAWLDEEQIPASGDFERLIREAIDESSHGLFIVTHRWLERDWTRTELKLFSDRPSDTHRRVAVRREEISTRDLQPYLQHLHVVKWLPDDTEPDARFWEVYCGLSNTPPGPRDRWAERGRALLAKNAPPPHLAADPPAAGKTHAEPKQQWHACASRPALALATREGTFLLTESGACFRFDHDEPSDVQTLSVLESWSAAIIEPGGSLVVGLYGAMIAWFKDNDWVYRAADAAVLALATSPEGVVIGDAAGSIVFRDRRGEVSATATLGEPIVDLCAADQGVAALGGRGALARLAWPDEGSASVAPVAPAKGLGPVVGLFAAGHPGRFGAYSAERLATIDGVTGRVTIGDRSFPDGINVVVPLARGGKRLTYGVVTDAGALWLVESDLKEARVVPLPGEPKEIAGICHAGAGGLLAWTTCGALYAVSRDRAVRKLPTTDVILAFPGAEHSDRPSAVRWILNTGMQIVPVPSDLER